MRSGIVTLLSDFGTRDPFVGIMKGVILGIHPQVHLVDLTHHVRPQDIYQAAFHLSIAVNYFPPGTVHLVVVDPGVGSGRRALVCQGEKHFYVAPDNGVLSLAWRRDPPVAIRQVQPGHWTLPRISRTFHGRDVFAPAAGHLCRGTAVDMMGPPVDDPVRLDIPENGFRADAVETHVIHVDTFGNLVTSLHAGELGGRRVLAVEAAGRAIPIPMRDTYSDVSEGQLLALWGSADYLEVSVNRGSAAEALGLAAGSPVRVRLAPKE